MDPAFLALVFIAILIIATVLIFFKKTSIFQKKSLDSSSLLALVSSLGDGVIFLDSSNNLKIINPTAINILGGGNFTSLDNILTTIGTRANLKFSISEAIKTRSVIKLNEFVIGNKVVQAEVEPVVDNKSSLMGVVVVLHDITSQKQLERLHDEFTAMMVHELRTPLTTTLYSTNMLLTDFKKMKAEDIFSQIQTIQTTTNHLLSLVTDLLDVSKIEAGKFQIVRSLGSVNQLIEQRAQVLKPLSDQKHLQIKTQLQQDLPSIEFDPNRITQVLDNLLSNAIKYTEAGEVTIKTINNGHEIEVQIQDTGEGILPQDLPKLFSKFMQLGSGRTGKKAGTGLGLVITKGIVEAHGGRVWATSKGERQGSTFIFTLPITNTYS